MRFSLPSAAGHATENSGLPCGTACVPLLCRCMMLMRGPNGFWSFGGYQSSFNTR